MRICSVSLTQYFQPPGAGKCGILPYSSSLGKQAGALDEVGLSAYPAGVVMSLCRGLCSSYNLSQHIK